MTRLTKGQLEAREQMALNHYNKLLDEHRRLRSKFRDLEEVVFALRQEKLLSKEEGEEYRKQIIDLYKPKE